MNLIENLPSFLQDFKEYKEICSKEDIELDKLKSEIEKILHETIVGEAKSYGLDRYEKIYGLENASNSISTRRFNILSKMNNRIPFTIKWLDNKLRQLIGENNYKIEVDYNNYKITIRLTYAFNNVIDLLQKELREQLPANLEISIFTDSTVNIDSSIIPANCITNYEIVSVPLVSPKRYKTMTAIIDLTNSDPATCITYTDDATDMEAKSDAWDEFFGHYPCLFKEGQEVGKLNRNNFAQFEDGKDADITSGDVGDVMIAFPRRGLKIETSEDENTLTVSMTDNPNDPNFSYYAHQRGENQKDIFYLGAYKSCLHNGKLRSLSNKDITVDRTIGDFRTLAQANGRGYEQSAFYQLIYRQAMFILKYKNLNSQTALGKGYTETNNFKTKTGNTNNLGMDFGEITGKLQMKLFGIEDFWGNVSEFIDGVFSGKSKNILTATENFNNNLTGYEDCIQATSSSGGFIEKVLGSSKTGFIIKSSRWLRKKILLRLCWCYRV